MKSWFPERYRGYFDNYKSFDKMTFEQYFGHLGQDWKKINGRHNTEQNWMRFSTENNVDAKFWQFMCKINYKLTRREEYGHEFLALQDENR